MPVVGARSRLSIFGWWLTQQAGGVEVACDEEEEDEEDDEEADEDEDDEECPELLAPSTEGGVAHVVIVPIFTHGCR